MAFDLKAKQNQPIVAYLATRKALLLDSIGSSRPVIRRLLSSCGVKTANIDVAENFKEAVEKIEKTSPHILFSEYLYEGSSGMDLCELQKKQYPLSFDRVFMTMSEKNSPSIASRVAEEDGDSLLIRPFNYNMLEERFLEVVKAKITPTPAQKAAEQAKALIETEKFEEAEAILGKVCAAPNAPSIAHSYMGLLKRRQKLFDDAVAAFEMGLQVDPKSYRCLMGLFDLRMEQKEFSHAYELGRVCWKEHPLSPTRVQDLIVVSVFNRKFSEVLGYYDFFVQLNEPDSVLQTYLSAGLVVYGKYMLRQSNKDEAVGAFKKAQQVCNQKPIILREIISSMAVAGLAAEVDSMLALIPNDIKDGPEMSVAILEQTNTVGPADKGLQAALGLLQKNVKEWRVFEIAIERSIEIKRKRGSIEELIDEATRLFPDRKEFLDSLSLKIQ